MSAPAFVGASPDQARTRVAAAYDRAASWPDPAVFLALAGRDEVLDALDRADPAAPLYGMVFAVKDNIDVAGLATTAGCPSYRSVPECSAPVVERLQAAGAVCIGKTNLDQFATGLVGTRSPYGTPINPVDAALVPGGSSSGSAVAVAAGLVDFALGTDTAGSGRVPAAQCRIVGLKPTKGRLSTRGVVPAVRSIDCVTVFAADVATAWRVFCAADVFDPLDPYARAVPNGMKPASTEPAGTAAVRRVGIPATVELDSDADRQAWNDACARLAGTGVELVTVERTPFLDAARLLYDGAWVAERYAAVGAFLDEQLAAGAEGIDPTVAAIIGGARHLSAVDAYRSAYRLAELRRASEATWDQIDALLLPTTPGVAAVAEVAADPVGRNSRLGTYTNFANLLDLCALAVPGPDRPDGRPFGVQFVAPAQHDAALAALAAHFSGEASPVAEPSTEGWFPLVVVGAHLSGQPLNGQLIERGGRLLAATHTAPIYRFYALAGTVPAKPGLVRVADGASDGAAIEVELWALPPETVGSFVATVAAPLCIGTVQLADGTAHHGFLCEPAGLQGATDITELGGWRAYRAQQP